MCPLLDVSTQGRQFPLADLADIFVQSRARFPHNAVHLAFHLGLGFTDELLHLGLAVSDTLLQLEFIILNVGLLGEAPGEDETAQPAGRRQTPLPDRVRDETHASPPTTALLAMGSFRIMLV
jgi:hypothetical protein